MLWKKLQRRRGNLGAQCTHQFGSTNIGNAEPPGYYQTSPKLASAYSLRSNTPLEKRELRKRHGGVGQSGQEVAWTWICSSTAKSQAPAAKGACQLLKLIIKYQHRYWALYIVHVSWKESCISLLGTTTTLWKVLQVLCLLCQCMLSAPSAPGSLRAVTTFSETQMDGAGGNILSGCKLTQGQNKCPLNKWWWHRIESLRPSSGLVHDIFCLTFWQLILIPEYFQSCFHCQFSLCKMYTAALGVCSSFPIFS